MEERLLGEKNPSLTANGVDVHREVLRTGWTLKIIALLLLYLMNRAATALWGAGLNPAKYCVDDKVFDNTINIVLALQSYSVLRWCMMVVSSYMLDSIFLHEVFAW
jgi:hypothetical protein